MDSKLISFNFKLKTSKTFKDVSGIIGFNNIEILENTLLCPSCKSGFMTKRMGKYGNFLGCTNYPKCKNTINLE